MIREARQIKMSEHAISLAGTVSCVSMFVDHAKKILNFLIKLESEYKETFVASRILNIVKYVMSADCLTKMNVQF